MNKIICYLNNFLMTDDIDKLGSDNRIIAPFFLGTYPVDIFPYRGEKTCWIWNTDKQNKGGTHWVAIWVDKGKMVFFDSFGLDIKRYKNERIWGELAEKNKLIIEYYHHGFFQNVLTKTCGVWSLIFLYQQCYNKNKK